MDLSKIFPSIDLSSIKSLDNSSLGVQQGIHLFKYEYLRYKSIYSGGVITFGAGAFFISLITTPRYDSERAVHRIIHLLQRPSVAASFDPQTLSLQSERAEAIPSTGLAFLR